MIKITNRSNSVYMRRANFECVCVYVCMCVCARRQSDGCVCVYVCMGFAFLCVRGLCTRADFPKMSALQKASQESIFDCSRGNFWPRAPRSRLGGRNAQNRGHGPHWGGQKCVKTQGFGSPLERPRWPRALLEPMGRTGVAKNT